MANPEGPQRKKKVMQQAADYVRKTTPGLKKKKVTQLVKLKVIDFTIWNGFKFGFGLMLGVAGFSIVAIFAAFLIKMFLLGLANYYVPV